MARLSGITIPDDKRVEIALTYMHGLGKFQAKKILEEVGIDSSTRVKDLTDTDLANIQKKIIELQIPVEGELRRIVRQNIRRLQEIKSYRGLRHRDGLPTRGQRTSHNARTRKGKAKTVGGLKRKLAKK